MHKFPEGTEISAEVAIAALDAHKELINDSLSFHELWMIFSSAARRLAEMDEKDWPVVKVLWIVADACSLRLQAEEVNSPFIPSVWFPDRHSALVEYFGPDEVAVFSVLAQVAINRKLRARLSDLAWLLSRPKDKNAALTAIDSYVKFVPNEDNWVETINEWRRAITLCKQLRGDADALLVNISSRLFDEADRALKVEGSLGLSLAQLIFDCKIEGDKGDILAELVAQQGHSMVEQGSHYFKARSFLALANQWFSRLGNPERAADMDLESAKSYEKEADARIASDPGSGYLVAQEFIEDAIQALRKISRRLRGSRRVDEEISRLSQRLTEIGEEAVKSMQTFTTESTDLTELVQMAEASVSGLDKLQALIKFADLHPFANISNLTINAKDSLKRFVFGRLASSTHISEDGRVVAKTPAAGLNADSEVHEDALFAKIMEHHAIEMKFVGQGLVLPAWRVLAMEYTIAKYDISQIVAASPIVPPGRVDQFTKGFWEGFNGDFAAAIYLLAPQLEALTRFHLKRLGAQTTFIDQYGIENEVGLSSLVEKIELKKVFDENTIFQIKAIFCSPLGANFRNAVAHGLLGSEEGRSVESIYAWWWIFRLVVGSGIRSSSAGKHRSPPSGD